MQPQYLSSPGPTWTRPLGIECVFRSSKHIAKVGFRREGPCDGFSDSNPSWPPLLSTLRGRFQTTIQSQMARTWRREFRPEHAFVRIKMLFLERVTTSSREHAKDEI